MINIYGSRISYYAGKLETYLRYRSIEYQLLPMSEHAREIRAGAGAVQSPTVKLEDGRWLSDTTPILAWFESQREGVSIYPEDPGMRFLALLLEDYADEWLWRPAMHYRWSYRQDNDHASGVLADEMLRKLLLPRFLKRKLIARRQFKGFVQKEGVSDATRGHVDATAMAAYDGLEAILAERPFLLGERPTIADFGLMAPMLRHFGQDPTPAELMRNRAPRLYAWVARMWAAGSEHDAAAILSSVDAPLAALLREACETHLVQLRENARAYTSGARHFAVEVQGCRYASLPVSRYRVWCLEQLRKRYAELSETLAADARELLQKNRCWDPLWLPEELASGHDPEDRAPFATGLEVLTARGARARRR